jgi:Trehalose-6-phosphate synthase
VGNVNSKFRTLDWSPILYIYRRISQAELVSIMKNSDIFLITPIKDGLNLVAEEYLLLNDTGIPIISKFAGISNYLNLVPKVNPYDPMEVSETIFNIINEDKKEIKRKNLEMTKIVKSLDIFNWLNNMIL